MADLREAVRLQHHLNRLYSSRGFGYFLDCCVIRPHDPARFSTIAEPWQWEIIRPKRLAIEGLSGHRTPLPNEPRSFLTVLPRGHDKSSLEGRIASWLLCFSKRPIQGYICAADKDQGALVLEAMEAEAKLNPWYGTLLDFNRNSVSGPMGVVNVVPADAGSAYGFRGNLYILDEITHWPNDGTYKAIVSGREKVPGTILVAITNAGILGSWQHKTLITEARTNSDWVVFERPGQLASWMPPSRVDALARLLPKIEADRVLRNIWVDLAVASEFLDAIDVDQCLDYILTPHLTPLPGYKYVLAVDYAPYRDRTALVIVHQDWGGRLVVDRSVMLKGDPNAEPKVRVQIADVDSWIEDMFGLYKPCALVFDEYQMEGTIQKQEALKRPAVRYELRGGHGAKELAMLLRELVANHRLRIPVPVNESNIPGLETLLEELKQITTKYNSLGFRFENGKTGTHDDRAVAITMAAREALKYPPVKVREPEVYPPAHGTHQVRFNLWGQG